MNLSRTLFATASAISVLAAIGCTSTQRAPEVATAPAPMSVPAAAPEQVAVAETMPSHPALQNERTVEVAPTSGTSVVVVNEPVVITPAPAPTFTPAPTTPSMATSTATPTPMPTTTLTTAPPADFIERAPKADRN